MKTQEELISAFKDAACTYRKVAIQENLREFRTLAWVLGIDDTSQLEIAELGTEEEVLQYIDQLVQKEPDKEQPVSPTAVYNQIEEKITGAIVRRLEERVDFCYDLATQNRAVGATAMASYWSTKAQEATEAIDMIQQKDYEVMNTKIDYVYRDADNYKVHNECVIVGVLTEEQINTILECLDSGEYFIPHKVGLPEVKFDETTEADHDFFELGQYGFEQTKKRPTLLITADELVEAFKKCKDKWEEEIVPPVRGRAR